MSELTIFVLLPVSVEHKQTFSAYKVNLKRYNTSYCIMANTIMVIIDWSAASHHDTKNRQRSELPTNIIVRYQHFCSMWT